MEREFSVKVGINKKDRWRSIQVHESTVDRIEECKKEFLKEHPEMSHIPIGRDTILRKICDFYMES